MYHLIHLVNDSCLNDSDHIVQLRPYVYEYSCVDIIQIYNTTCTIVSCSQCYKVVRQLSKWFIITHPIGMLS